MIVKVFLLTVILQLLLIGAGKATEKANHPPSPPPMPVEQKIDATEVIHSALVLAFAYGVLRRFWQDE